jgi:UDP-N-acetyl-D-glucosamine dehydrogenase
VVGFDTDAVSVKALNAGESYVEDVTSATLAAALDSGRYRATTAEANLDGFEVALITVPTPLSDGIPDLSCVASASSTLARHLTRGATVVLESTTYPAAADAVVLQTDHDAFDLAALAQASRYFLDTRHRASGPRVEYL